MMENKILNLCSIISNYVTKNDKKLEDIISFIEWGLKNLPEVIKNDFVSNTVFADNKTSACITFDINDYIWWKKNKKSYYFRKIKDIETIKKEVFEMLLIKYTDVITNTEKDKLENAIREIQEIYK